MYWGHWIHVMIFHIFTWPLPPKESSLQFCLSVHLSNITFSFSEYCFPYPSPNIVFLFLPRSSSPPQKWHFPSPNIAKGWNSNERFALFTCYGLYFFFQASLPPGFLTVPRLRWYRNWLQLERNKWIWNELSVNFTSYTNSHEISSTKAFYRIGHCLRVLLTLPSLWLWS